LNSKAPANTQNFKAERCDGRSVCFSGFSEHTQIALIIAKAAEETIRSTESCARVFCYGKK